MTKLSQLLAAARAADQAAERHAANAQERQMLWREVVRAHAENMWVIPLVSQGKVLGVLRNDFGNVSQRAIASWIAMTPGYLNPETFYLRR